MKPSAIIIVSTPTKCPRKASRNRNFIPRTSQRGPKINIVIENHQSISDTIDKYGDYISTQTLAESISLAEELKNSGSRKIELNEEISVNIRVTKTDK